MLKKVELKNFRLLRDIELNLESQSTVIVGRNNSGKTSLAELFRRLIGDNSPMFGVQDFSLCVLEEFWTAYTLVQQGKFDDAEVALPKIQVALVLSYEQSTAELGHLSDFIVDLDPNCTDVRIEISYELAPERLKHLLNAPISGLNPDQEESKRKTLFFQAMKERVTKHYRCTLTAVDPNDQKNRKPIEWSKLRLLIQGDFIGAQRGLDDVTHKDSNTLGRILHALLNTAESESADQDDRKTVLALKAAVSDVQSNLDTGFNEQLKRLLPAIHLFGYPGLADPNLLTETLLDVELLLKNHTRIRYSGIHGVHLPEGHNGLGSRNLIYILLKLLEAFKSFKARPTSPSVHLVFIEEPEAHLHPQMQEVFISQLTSVAQVFAEKYSPGTAWPVQFVVSTHSSHIANRAPFESLRYFLSTPDTKHSSFPSTRVKDIKNGLGSASIEVRNFLHQYMTLTRCDLFFADKAVLVEGTAERILMPRIIEKVDAELPESKKLGHQYISIIEVGGAYAHLFFDLIDFLELKTLIITDLDSVDKHSSGKACKVSQGTHTSNACLKKWFGVEFSPAQLIVKSPKENIKGNRRLAFQVPEHGGDPCGRSFEDAFILANPQTFPVGQQDPEDFAWTTTRELKKSEFALRYAIDEQGWNVPRYIKEGLLWLADVPMNHADSLSGASQVAA